MPTERAPIESWNDMPSEGLRGVVRAGALWALAGAYGATGRLRRGLEIPRVHFLYLHHVFDDEEAGFRRLVHHLSRRHRLIGYSEAVERVLEGRIDDRYVCFSFDDGVRSCLTAARVLEEFDARGCFFVLPGIVGETDPRRLEEFCIRRLGGRSFEFMNWSEIEELRARGHEIGSHTLSHPRVASLTPDRMRSEIFDSRTQLERHVGEVRHFAWPFGRFDDFDPTAARLVFEAGYTSCASAVRGCHVAPPAKPSELCIRRENTVAAWPLAFMDFFLARSALRAGERDNRWPADWAFDVEEPDPCASRS